MHAVCAVFGTTKEVRWTIVLSLSSFVFMYAAIVVKNNNKQDYRVCGVKTIYIEGFPTDASTPSKEKKKESDISV